MNTKILIMAGAAALAVAGAAMAAVTFDPATGTGFVGKGDVQLALGLNNAQLQSQAGSFTFAVNSSVVTESSWICTNARNEHTQERSRTTTQSTQGVFSSVERVRNQITGFILTGYSSGGGAITTTDGPALNSCPDNSSTWSLTSPAGDPVVVSSTSELTVNGVPLQ